MIQICEQIDGYRVTDMDDSNNTVIYFKKSKGWTQLLVEEAMCILDIIPEQLRRSYDEGYQDGKEDYKESQAEEV